MLEDFSTHYDFAILPLFSLPRRSRIIDLPSIESNPSIMDTSSPSKAEKPPKDRSGSKKKQKKKKKQKTKLKDKEYDVLVLRYLKKKGYKSTEQKLREEATIDDAAYTSIVQENSSISNLVMYVESSPISLEQYRISSHITRDRYRYLDPTISRNRSLTRVLVRGSCDR